MRYARDGFTCQKEKGTHIRLFDGTLRDAQGIIEVDRETFVGCAYSAADIVALEADPGQCAWVAVEEGQVVGFASAFGTYSLAAHRWEVDELAVRPACQGRGIGTLLVARAAAGHQGAPGVTQVRALIADRNVASQRAFAKSGFAPAAGGVSLAHELLLYPVTSRASWPQAAGLPAVRSACVEDASAIATLAGCPVARAARCVQRADNLYLLALSEQAVVGCAELLHVRTLQYQGLWLESLLLQVPEPRVARALFRAAIEAARCRASVDRLGYLAPPAEAIRYAACVGEGFCRVGAYRTYVREVRAT